jgi:ERCC4-type nuclease
MLLIDDRENPKVIDKILMRMGDAKLDSKGQARVLRMKSSDYRMGDWGIEAKEINDLYRSILGLGRSRTIVDQLKDLEREFENPFLVVYGTKLKPYIPGGRPTARLMAIETARMKKVIQQFKMNYFQRFPNIKYMELATMDEFVNFLVMNHHQINVKSKIGVSKLPLDIQKEITKTNLDPRIKILSSLDGITPRHAEDLLEKFGSIPKLLSARTTQKSVMEIEGLGREKAKRILGLRDNYQ